MKKGSLLILFLLFFFVFAYYSQVEARSGCCSHHGGVCGCGCCDGSGLSSTCVPYYPECSGGGQTAPVVQEPIYIPPTKYIPPPTRIPTSTPYPTATPEPILTPIPSPTKRPTPTLKPKKKTFSQPTKEPTIHPIQTDIQTAKSTGNFWSWFRNLFK